MEREEEKRGRTKSVHDERRETGREKRSARYNPNIRSYKSLIVTRGMPTPRWDGVRN